MSWWIAIILGLVQGLTEFLPVSSSGHLTFFEIAFGLSEGNVLYNVLLHFATLAALVVFMRKQICEIFKNPLGKKSLLLLFATTVTAVVGLFVDILIGADGNLLMISIGFYLTAFLLIVTDRFVKRGNYNPNAQIEAKHAFVIGAVQGIAVLPGLSRSGSTLSAGILCGAGKSQSAEFSFLLSLPIIIVSCAYEIYKGIKHGFSFSSTDILPMALGCIIAFVVAMLTLKFMMKIVKKDKWIYFSTYLSIFATAILIYGISCGCLT